MNKSEVLKQSPLANPHQLLLRKSETIVSWGKTAIVAPHPDDESLGCGGAIALLCEFGVEVSVLVLSDGTLSHPNSKKFPADKLRDLREAEILNALDILGVELENTTFFRYPDRSVPDRNSPGWTSAIEKCRQYLEKVEPQTVLVPWRRDPHPDHRAAYSLIKNINQKYLPDFKILEYPIWLWEIAESGDAPNFGEITAWRLDISSVAAKKKQAIMAHKSQITDLIDDDPEGFRLSEEILENFADDWEIYFESHDE